MFQYSFTKYVVLGSNPVAVTPVSDIALFPFSLKLGIQLAFACPKRCSKSAIKTLERRHSGVFVMNFEHTSHLFLMNSPLSMNK